MKKWALLVMITVGSLMASAQKLVLATYQYADNNRLANIQPLAAHIKNKLGMDVEIKSYPSVHDFIVGIQNNEVDIALINTFGYFLLNASSKKYAMKPVAVLKVKEGALDNYKTAIIALNQLPVDTLTDLPQIAARLKLALVNKGSTSGNLVPRLALSGVGIKNPESAFLALVDGKNHRATIDSLITGKAAIAAIGSSEYFSFIQKEDNRNQVKLLWLSPEIPLGPVLLHTRLSVQVKDALITLLTELDQRNNAALESVKNGWSEAKQAEKYIIIDDQYYAPFRKQLGDKKTMTAILKQFAN
jgi:phosphonate transport system substrate-binding protein